MMRRAVTIPGAVTARRSTPPMLLVGGTIVNHPTASAPPATTTYNASCNAWGSVGCLGHTRLLRTPTASGNTRDRPELHMEDIGAKLGQRTRFDRSGEIVFYDTSIRKYVRERLTGCLGATATEDPVRIVLTGMGGTGKSHNLARWVMEQRDAGHLVVYVNDMQNWIDSGDMYIFREIKFALHRWRGWKRGDEGFFGFKSSGGLLTHLNEAPDTSRIPPALWAEVDSLRMLVADVIDRSKSTLGGILVPKQTWTVDAGETLWKCANIASLVGKKCIFVVDQDNRLNKILVQLDFESKKIKAGSIDEVIDDNRAHMTVASASANNEGWDRRDWGDVVVQTAHGLDPNDADHMIRAALEPAGLYSEAVSVRIREETGCCPLDIKLICEYMKQTTSCTNKEALPGGATEMGMGGGGKDEKLLNVVLEREQSRTAVEEGIREWARVLQRDHLTYVSDLAVESQQRAAVSVLSDVEITKGVVDQRFMEFRNSPLHPNTIGLSPLNQNTFVYRNPYIHRVIRSWARLNVRQESFGDDEAAKYEQGCICALPFLLKAKNFIDAPIQRLSTVFPRRGDLDRVEYFAIFECVPHAMYVDAISVDYQIGDNKCLVGLYQATTNTKNHVDSYSGLLRSRELQQFLDDIQQLNPRIVVEVRFFWMVRMLRGEKFQIRNSTLMLEDSPKDTATTKWNFMHEGGLMKSVVSRRGDSKILIKEYVFVYNNNVEYPKPKFNNLCYTYQE